jgi:beta-lactamase class A
MQQQVEAMCNDFRGVAGVYMKDLTSGQTLSVRGEEEFPTASSIKIQVLTQLLVRAEKGEINLDEKIHIQPEHITPGSGVLTYLDGNVELSVLDIAILMILVSDNTATNLCIDWAGMDETNALVRQLGMKHTTLRRKMQDRAAIARGDENTSTPADMVAMMETLAAGRPSPWVAEKCLAILKKTKRTLLNRAVPVNLVVANKPGGMERVKCDVGIVYLPRRPYAVAAMTKYAMDESEAHERAVVDIFSTIHATMEVLDGSNKYGQGIAG